MPEEKKKELKWDYIIEFKEYKKYCEDNKIPFI